jgi:flagellar protein FlaF
MGFSVSGGFAVLAVGCFLAFGMFYGAAADAGERVVDAQREAFGDDLDRQNTAIRVTEATHYGGNETLAVEVKNVGTTALAVNATDVLADNTFLARPFAAEAVGGESGTGVWLPGETLDVAVTRSTTPDRVTVVTAGGVADADPVEVA